MFDVDNDFLMGLVCGFVGVICATIIDKRKGFWAAFWGMMVVVVVIGIIFLIAMAK